MTDFDPFGWFERLVPAKWLHRAIRVGLAAVCAVFLVARVEQYERFALKPLWAVETLVFVALLVAFIGRIDPVSRSKGLREVAVPIAAGLMPFALLWTPPSPWVVASRTLLLGVFWWMTAATSLTVWGMWTLRRSFSITVEARQVVMGGPYRWVRHPIYLGEILTAAAVAFWRFSLLNLLLLLLFILVQALRARWEEAKLAKTFPEYGALASRSWWVW